MAIPISKFGQYVKLTIKDVKDAVLFESDSFRVDFDIRNMYGWERAKVSIFNVDSEMVGVLLKNGKYLTIDIALHDGEKVRIANGLYISNVLNEISVPDSVLNFYCFSELKERVLDEQVDTYINTPSLRDTIDGITKIGGYRADVNYKLFPRG